MDEQISARQPVEVQIAKKIKQKKINKLRYAEYYDQQELLDKLYVTVKTELSLMR